MRVLHIINDLRAAGAEMLVAQLVPCLQKRGCIAQVALLADTASFVRDDLAASGVQIHVPSDTLSFHAAHKHIPYLANVMRKSRCDIAHVHLFPAQLWAALALQTLPPKKRPLLITTEHNTHNRRREARWGRILDTLMYGRYAHLIAITDATKTALCEWVPATASRTSVILNGVDLARIQTAGLANKTDLLGMSDEAAAQSRVVTCVGRLEKQKNQATLLRAMAELPDAHAVLVGVGEKEAELRSLADELHLTSRVHFVGRRADVPEILRISDGYAQPSLWEGFGIAVVEALAAGVPVVCADVPGLRDVVGGAGRLVPSDDAPALARALHDVLGLSPAQKAVVVENGKRQAQNFSIDACADAHVRLYNELLSRKDKPAQVPKP